MQPNDEPQGKPDEPSLEARIAGMRAKFSNRVVCPEWLDDPADDEADKEL